MTWTNKKEGMCGNITYKQVCGFQLSLNILVRNPVVSVTVNMVRLACKVSSQNKYIHSWDHGLFIRLPRHSLMDEPMIRSSMREGFGRVCDMLNSLEPTRRSLRNFIYLLYLYPASLVISTTLGGLNLHYISILSHWGETRDRCMSKSTVMPVLELRISEPTCSLILFMCAYTQSHTNAGPEPVFPLDSVWWTSRFHVAWPALVYFVPRSNVIILERCN